MKYSIFIAFSVVILLKIISICECVDGEGKEEEKRREPTNFEIYGKDLPERIKYWKSLRYGLEITGPITRDSNLIGYDLNTQNQARLIGKNSIVKKVDELLQHGSDSVPDFIITKMDPMSYEFEGQKMLITFRNIRLYYFNTYDRETAEYTQTGEYAFGTYKLTEDMYKAIIKKGGDLAARTKYLDNKYYLNRRDVEWTIKLFSKFITEQTVDEKSGKKIVWKPVIIEADYKIQPDPKASNQQGDSSKPPMRAKGVVEIAFYNFEFDLQFLITHTDDPLREFFPREKKVINLVPDFKAKYKMDKIEIVKNRLRLCEYDGDDEFPEKPDLKEDVNENLPPKVASNTKTNPKKCKEKKDIHVEHERELNEVAKHFEELGNLVRNDTNAIERKLYLNLIPKMTWKIMKMDTKRQLPYLIRDILLYDDNFQEKVKIQPVTLSDNIYQGVDFLKAHLQQGVKKLWNKMKPGRK